MKTENKSRTHGLLKSFSLARKDRAKEEGKIAEEMSPTKKTGFCNRITRKTVRAFQDWLGPMHLELKGKRVNLFGRQ